MVEGTPVIKMESVVIWSTQNASVSEEESGQFWVELPGLGEFGPIMARPDTMSGEGVAVVVYGVREASGF